MSHRAELAAPAIAARDKPSVGLRRTLTGVIGSGLVGYDPFDRRTWSGSSYQVFSRLRDRGCLHRAFGVEVSRLNQLWLKLRFVHPNRSIWRNHYYMSRAYREGLTRVVARRLRADDFDHDFFVLGAMFDIPSLRAGRAKCFSYHDGNLAQGLKSPYAPKGLSARRIDEGLSFERRIYLQTDRIFAMSEYLRRSFIEDFDVSPERVSVVGAGINLDEIPETVIGKRYDAKAILFIGVDFPRKGGPILLQAFRRVRDVHPDATLHIVGPPVLSIPLELAGGVTFHGFLNKSNPGDAAKLSTLFRECSLFVLPSLYEPFGIAPLEAMVHQIPAVVSRGWALRESVVPGVTGEHVEPGSVDDLAERLIELLRSPDTLKRWGSAARESVLAKFTWSHVVSRIIQEIEQVQSESTST
ncbi:MAG: glycosyltransferase family 4 protein [Planctomycetaceae bacterium]